MIKKKKKKTRKNLHLNYCQRKNNEFLDFCIIVLVFISTQGQSVSDIKILHIKNGEQKNQTNESYELTKVSKALKIVVPIRKS